MNIEPLRPVKSDRSLTLNGLWARREGTSSGCTPLGTHPLARETPDSEECTIGDNARFLGICLVLGLTCFLSAQALTPLRGIPAPRRPSQDQNTHLLAGPGTRDSALYSFRPLA